MNGVVHSLFRYPAKGFAPEPPQAVELRAVRGLPFERAYAVEVGVGDVDLDAALP
ncbi:MAG TPA: hypothetical protein VG841_10440 [Caulobacterales bacterium]|nr:hypothetical protein [Caulobacterales bacterium]